MKSLSFGPIKNVDQTVFFFHTDNETKNLQIRIKFDSHLQMPRLNRGNINNLNPMQEASRLGLDFKCFALPKKNHILLTILSSPHVHKKSREQYKIEHYRIYFLCNITNMHDYKKFLHLKIRLCGDHTEQGLNITFTYLKNFNLQGFLPVY